MELYAGIDLHSNNSVVSVPGENDRVVYAKRLPNETPLGSGLNTVRLTILSSTKSTTYDHLYVGIGT